GPPFSVYTQVLETYIDGIRVFDRSQQLDWSYQTGGFALLDRERLPKPPPPVRPLPAAKAPALPKDALTLKGPSSHFAILAGRINPVSHAPITNGIIVVKDGKTEAVTKDDALPFKLPPDMPILTAAVVTPGLIDAHTVVGLSGALNVSADQDQDELSD